MELKDFITTALMQVNDGIVNAQKEVKGITINPASAGFRDFIEFDISVSITDSKEKNHGFGLSVLPIGTWLQRTTREARGSQHRIKFLLPVSFPPLKG